jgi:hypothetical protein
VTTDRRNIQKERRPELEPRADELRRRLKDARLTQRDLARLRRQPEQTVSFWTTARRPVPEEAFAFLDLWERLPERDRDDLLGRARREMERT